MLGALPDQTRLWDAYGHALGAAVGLELLLRIALIKHAAQELMQEKRFDEDNGAKALAEIQGWTFGRTVRKFKSAFRVFADDAEFCESVGNAVLSRNYLAHGFLDGILLGLRSSDGVELATLECIERLEHFRSLEQYVLERSPVDYAEFFELGEGRAEDYVKNHPLREKLQAIRAGKGA